MASLNSTGRKLPDASDIPTFAKFPALRQLTGPLTLYRFGNEHGRWWYGKSLIDEMKNEGFRVSRPTVYRNLRKLVDAGLLRKINLGTRTVYEHDYGYAHHDHVHCETCGTMIEFQDPSLDALIRDVCQQHNFQYQGHTFVIRGTCAACNRARMTKRRLDLV